MNSDMPRTDAAACDGTTVPADFAADLERELNEAKADAERLREVAKQALEALEGFVYHGYSNVWTQAITGLREAVKETK
jgi:phage shock protein A